MSRSYKGSRLISRIILTAAFNNPMYTFSNITMKAILLLLSVLAFHGYAEEDKVIGEKAFLHDVQNGANNFSLNLFKTALKNETGNYISSPFSAYMVLTMASYGAEGDTREELQKVLHLPKQGDAAEGIVKKILRSINQKLMFLEPVYLMICNKIFVSSGLSINPEYQEILGDTFLSPLAKVDFANSEKTARRINSWSKRFTFGQIKKIVSKDEVNSDMALMLVNSVFFSGKWKVPFDTKFTLSRPFYVNETLTKKVPTMLQEGEFQFGELPQMNATFVVLPYQDGDEDEDATYMYIIRPKKINGLAKIEENIDSLTLQDLNNTEKYEFELHVPKFKLEGSCKLNDYLTQMGVKTAFSEEANFDGMTLEHQKIAINRVVQKAFISIDEKGTKAAAVTGMEFQFRMGPIKYRIDRPFLLLIATKDIILFAGKVVDPSV